MVFWMDSKFLTKTIYVCILIEVAYVSLTENVLLMIQLQGNFIRYLQLDASFISVKFLAKFPF